MRLQPAIACGALLLGAPLSSILAQKYVVQELAPVSSFGARVFDIADDGTAVGHGLSPLLQQHALRWSPAVLDLTPVNALAEAQGISESGLVAGWMRNAAGSTEAVRWNGAQPTFLGMLPGHVGSFAQDANDAGLVAGWSVTPVGDPVASVWTNGQIEAIGATFSWAFALSETGDVVGRRWVGVDIEAFRWRDHQLITLPDLGPNNAQAVGISPLGRIAGAAASASDGKLHGVLWDQQAQLTDLGLFQAFFSTAATDVNDAGVAVGGAIDLEGNVFAALVWRGNGAENLNALVQPGTGWVLRDAQAINARGEIVGIGTQSGSSGDRAFLLRPDCDGDAVADLDEIAAGTAHDANQDGLADACQHCQPSLGFGGPGSMRLTVCGDPLTEADSAATLEVAQAAVGTPVFVAVSAVEQPLPLGGGILVPGLPLTILPPLPPNPSGSVALVVHGAAATPAQLIVQAAALVAGEIHLSNALKVEIGLP